MELKINRNQTTRLYTLGELLINGMKTTYTVEDTLTMLESGIYKIRLRKDKKRRRVIAIIPTSPHKGGVGGGLYHFAPNGSHISSRKNLSVCIGESIIPGALKNGLEVYNRIFDRIEKAEGRKEDILLVIIDERATYADPVKYWDESSDHGCPPTKRRVEVDSDGNATIYEGNIQVDYISIEEQKALREA